MLVVLPSKEFDNAVLILMLSSSQALLLALSPTVVAVVMVVINKYVDKKTCTLHLHLRAVTRVRLCDLRFGIPEDEFKVNGV